MDNRVVMWKVVGVIAVLSIVASAGMIYSVFRELAELTPKDSSTVDEILKAVQTTDPSFAKDN